MFLNRAEFLRELRENLRGRVNDNTLEDIVYDYNEHFDAGLRDGKSEQEVSVELGSPARIAREVLAEGPTNQVNQRGLDIAPLGPRVVAFTIDALISSLPIILVTKAFNVGILAPLFPLMALQYPVRVVAPNTVITWTELVPGILSVLFFVLYQPVCMSLWQGRTIGKRIMSLKVIRKNGQQLTPGFSLFREVLGRTIVNVVSFGFSSIISFLWALFSPERRTIHDEVGGTRVVVDHGYTT